MDANAPDSLLRWLGELEDPRPGRNVMQRLSDLPAIAILAILCGADSGVDVMLWGRCKCEWPRTFPPLPHAIPSHDTFGRVVGRMAPAPFERCFMNGTAALVRACSWDHRYLLNVLTQ
jgi:hypothetical protein